MGNLYRLNSLFELEISQYPEVLQFDKGLLERSQILEYLFLVLSQEKDFTILSEQESEELIDYWEKNKINHGNIFKTDNMYYAHSIPINKKLKEYNLIEWGRTSYIKYKDSILLKQNQTIFQSKFINSKINQIKWKDTLKINSLNSVLCTNKTEMEYCLSCLELPLVVKSEFGFSGRGNTILKTETDIKNFSAKINYMFRGKPNGFIIEEWKEEQKLLDFSGLFDVSSRVSTFLAVTKMLVDKFGVYRGSLIQKKFGESLIAGLQRVANDTKRFNTSYSGPISIDGFTFKNNSETKIQYMSEINYRYSMGRILYDLNEKIGTKKEDCALIFLPIKAKSLQFKSVILNLSKLEKEFSARVLLSAEKKLNPFAVFYISTQADFPIKIIDSIKKVIS
jgi:ATP-grasp domain